jgi:hypothetical protein
MGRLPAGLVLILLLLAGCAAPGPALVGGVSTADDVVRRMGQPAERVQAADGDLIWFYPNQPFGRTMHAVRVARDGRVRSVEQVLTEAHVARVVAGQTTRAQVREMFGPPYQSQFLPRQQREVWTWTMWNIAEFEYFLHIQMSTDGIVREVLMLRDWRREQGDLFFRF